MTLKFCRSLFFTKCIIMQRRHGGKITTIAKWTSPAIHLALLQSNSWQWLVLSNNLAMHKMCNATIWQCIVLSYKLQQNSKKFPPRGRYSILPSCISYLWLLTHHHSWWCILMRMNAFLFLSLADPTPPTNFSLYLRSTSTFASPQVPSLWHPDVLWKISFRHYQSEVQGKLPF